MMSVGGLQERTTHQALSGVEMVSGGPLQDILGTVARIYLKLPQMYSSRQGATPASQHSC